MAAEPQILRFGLMIVCNVIRNQTDMSRALSFFAWFPKEKIQAGDVYVDGNRIGNVGNAVMKDRKTMASDGIVVVIANIDTKNNILLGSPNITTRGFVLVNDNLELLKQLEEIVKNAINTKIQKHINYNEIKAEIVTELSEYIMDKTGRKPIILPVIMDIKKEIKIQN